VTGPVTVVGPSAATAAVHRWLRIASGSPQYVNIDCEARHREESNVHVNILVLTS